MGYPSEGTPKATNFSTSATSFGVVMPTTVTANDLLLVFIQTRYAQTWTPPTGWTQLFVKAGGSSVGQLSAFYKKASGSEGGTTITWTGNTLSTATAQAIDISGWDGSTTPEYVNNSGDSTTNPSSSSLTPSGGGKQYLWLAVVGDAATGAGAFTSAPSGFSGFNNSGLGSGAGGGEAELATSYLQATASSENPGVWGYASNRYWASATIAITPTSATPKMETLVDAFNQTTLNSSLWTQTTGGSATMSYASGGAQVNYPASSTSSTVGRIASKIVYDLTGSYALLQVLTEPSSSTAADANFYVCQDNNVEYPNNALFFQIEAGVLYANKIVAGTQTHVWSATWTSSYAWLRIRESGGTSYWETSSDGINWTTQHSETNPITVTSLYVEIQGNCYEAETSPGTYKWNNLNNPPTSVPVYSSFFAFFR